MIPSNVGSLKDRLKSSPFIGMSIMSEAQNDSGPCRLSHAQKYPETWRILKTHYLNYMFVFFLEGSLKADLTN